ncbi:MAG: hypothetical protein WCC36_15955 [Gammaproteobacteria bacterium]
MLKQTNVKQYLAVIAGMLIAATVNSPVQAASLNLVQSFPDLQVQDLPISYVADSTTGTVTGTFSVSGQYGLLLMNSGTTTNYLVNGPYDYNLSAQLDGSGSLLSGGFLKISDSQGNSVLSADLTNFSATGAGTGSSVFEFTTSQASGSLTTAYPGLQNNLGIIMNAVSTSTFVDFTHNFSATVYADHFAVPVPPAAWLFGSGLIGLVAAGRRRQSAA